MSGHEHGDDHSAHAPSHHADHHEEQHGAHHVGGHHEEHHEDAHAAKPEEAGHPEVSEKKDDVSGDKEISSVLVRIKNWVKEVLNVSPVVKLTTSGPCDDPEGRYIGLNKKQKKKLKVKKGYVVSLYNPKTQAPLGCFVVGKDTHSPDGISFKANGVSPKMEVDLKRITKRVPLRLWREDPAKMLSAEMPIKTGIESDKKHESRRSIIEKRFGKELMKNGIDADTYIVIPTAHLKLLKGHQEKSDLTETISMCSLMVGDEGNRIFKKIPIVPAGSDFAMTKKAEEYLGIRTDDPKGIKFGIARGHLVIMDDQLKKNDQEPPH